MHEFDDEKCGLVGLGCLNCCLAVFSIFFDFFRHETITSIKLLLAGTSSRHDFAVSRTYSDERLNYRPKMGNRVDQYPQELPEPARS